MTNVTITDLNVRIKHICFENFVVLSKGSEHLPVTPVSQPRDPCTQLVAQALRD